METLPQFSSVTSKNEKNSELENLFLSAAERGEKNALMLSLGYLDLFDVNCVDGEGKSAVRLAIENRNLDILEILACHRFVELGDALLQAVNLQFTTEVRSICKALELRGLLPAGLYCRCRTGEIAADVTPAVLAAQLNNYDILKILLEYGAEVKDPSSYEFYSEEYTLEHSVGTIAVYQAITSEAYISLTAADPIGRAFELSSEMRRLSGSNFEFRFQYEELSTRCERFAASLLGFVRNSEEQLVVMTHDPKTWSREDFQGDFMEPLKVKKAIKHDQKKFVAHPHCQQHLVEHWYSGLSKWRKLTTAKRMAYSVLVMALFPIITLCYIVAPDRSPGNLLSIPYIRFLTDFTSQSVFLCLLALHFVDFMLHPEHEDDVPASPAEVTPVLPTCWEILIVVFVVAYSVQCAVPLVTSGLHWFKHNPRSKLFDLATLLFFWGWIILRCVAAYRMYNGDESVELFMARSNSSLQLNISNSSLGSFYNFPNETDTEGSVDVYLKEINRKLDLMVEKDSYLDTKLQRYFENQPSSATGQQRNRRAVASAARTRAAGRADDKFRRGRPQYTGQLKMSAFPPGHPVLISKAFLAIAKVFSFLRIVRMTVVHLKVGPMQISFGRMGGDIMKFMTIFILILVAFAVGLTELYHLYADDMFKECVSHTANHRHCRLPYNNFQSSLMTLFWTLFGMTDLRSLDVVVADHWVTEFIGYCLFAVYHVIAIVALLNILIAMMSNTYNKIEGDADIQWKYSRTNLWMSYYEESSALAPPFNLLPQLSWFKSCSRKDREKQRRSMQIEISEMDRKYTTLAKELVHRYFFDKKTAIFNQRDFCNDILMVQLKSSMSGIKYDMFETLLSISNTLADVHQNMADGNSDESLSRKAEKRSVQRPQGSEFLQMMLRAIEERERSLPRLPIRPENFIDEHAATSQCPLAEFSFIDSEENSLDERSFSEVKDPSATDSCENLNRSNGATNV
ncbi:short transient receptor potential channel 7-like [Ptychodera flava]|uniref:short transient receptor potential channel 7-like n=1 Tax=Ptychodera flava TaxID=63121 RepID=UPI00396A53FB